MAHLTSQETEVSQLLKDILQKVVIQLSHSPWAAPIVLVQKRMVNPSLLSRRLLQLWDQLLLKDDILSASPAGQDLCDKLVVPKSLRSEVLGYLHEGAVGAQTRHCGS